MPTNMLKFTHAKIDELPIPTARMTYMDPSAPTGFRLRVTETGAKAWYWLHRVDGKWSAPSWPYDADLTPDKARLRARGELNGGEMIRTMKSGRGGTA